MFKNWVKNFFVVRRGLKELGFLKIRCSIFFSCFRVFEFKNKYYVEILENLIRFR